MPWRPRNERAQKIGQHSRPRARIYLRPVGEIMPNSYGFKPNKEQTPCVKLVEASIVVETRTAVAAVASPT